MAEKYFVRNPGTTKVHVHGENGVRVLLKQDESLEFSSKAAAEAAAFDYNSARVDGVDIVVETKEVEDTPEPTEAEVEEKTPVTPTDEVVKETEKPVEPTAPKSFLDAKEF